MQHRLKVVFDTNIYISAIVFGGAPLLCLEAARSREVELYVSKGILLELTNKLESKFLHSRTDTEKVLTRLSKFAKIITPKEKLTIIKDDPSDNMILEAAVEAKTDFIVSGDKKHILSLKEFRGIKIISPADFLKQF